MLLIPRQRVLWFPLVFGSGRKSATGPPWLSTSGKGGGGEGVQASIPKSGPFLRVCADQVANNTEIGGAWLAVPERIDTPR